MFNKWTAALAVMMLLATGCSKNDKTDVEYKDNEIEETAKDVSEEKELPFQFPLTGVETDEKAKGRAVAVMINNHPAARPQSGLEKADVVYELLAEGDVTRFLAIYQSEKPEKIGPVRSARDYFIELAKGYNSLYIAHGNSPDAKALLDKGYIDHLNGLYYDGTLFNRASFRKAPHNSYITFENILKGAEQNNYAMEESPPPLTFLKKSEVDAIDGEEAQSAMVSYFSSNLFNVIFEYDETLGKYKRYSNGELTADYDSGEPVLLDNIFIVETDHKIIDNVGRRAINLTSGGRGYLLQKGKWKAVDWKNIDGRILPIINGKETGLVPGRTWINLIPADPGLEQTVSFDRSNRMSILKEINICKLIN
ncbi:DUF3048 domain-containing protein [Bacillus sp. FJAT-29790]|uniref:DUF3048 domain-containing protein n=1 Tax=Bacillus sp. FJAT-29790 TaxID=1895002 RepID=UPI001C216D34|nr:DUF3048 domain-containing protein [Bacillus sp. FJAT-29790]MBU8880290.1 DUF3048 domain-containing protein [Bacillus sp. FJAT-29790]